MAFPTRDSFTTSVEATDQTSHDVSLASGAASGKLAIGVVRLRWQPDHHLARRLDGDHRKHLKRDGRNGRRPLQVLDGSEGSTITITTSAAEESAHGCLVITGYDTSTPIVGAASGLT